MQITDLVLLFCSWVDYPKKQSNILAGIKHEEEVGERRALNLMAKCDQITEVRKQRKQYGSLPDKDLSKWFHLWITPFKCLFDLVVL